MKNRQVIEADQFLGLNESVITKGDARYFVSGKNFIVTDDGRVQKIWGSRKSFEDHGFNHIHSLFFHDDISAILMAYGMEGGDPKIKVNQGNTWSSEKTLPATMVVPTKPDMVWWISYLNQPYFFSGDNIGIYRSKTTQDIEDLNKTNYDWYVANGGNPSFYKQIRGKFPVIHFNSMWFAGNGAWKNIMIYTKPYTNICYDMFTGGLDLLFVSVGGDDTASGSVNDEITFAEEFGSDLIVLKKKSIHKIIGYNTNQYRSVPITTDVGTIYPESVQKTRNGIIFLESVRNGFWKYDGTLKNISRPRIDSLIGELQKEDTVRSGVFASRFYMFSLPTKTLIYDTDLDVWEVEDASYGSFAILKKESDIFIAARNKYSMADVDFVDPLRPLETQKVLKKVYDGCDILELGVGSVRSMEADGTSGEEIEFSVTTPHIDCGTMAQQKCFQELILHFQTAEPVIEVDMQVDERFYRGLKGVILPKDVLNKMYWNVNVNYDVQSYMAIIRLPFEATGDTVSFTIRQKAKSPFKINRAILYYRVKGRIAEEKE